MRFARALRVELQKSSVDGSRREVDGEDPPERDVEANGAFLGRCRCAGHGDCRDRAVVLGTVGRDGGILGRVVTGVRRLTPPW